MFIFVTKQLRKTMKTEYRFIFEDSRYNFEAQINNLAEKGFSPVGSHQHFKDDGYYYYSIIMGKDVVEEKVRSWIHVLPQWNIVYKDALPEKLVRVIVRSNGGATAISKIVTSDAGNIIWQDDDKTEHVLGSVYAWMKLPE